MVTTFIISLLTILIMISAILFFPKIKIGHILMNSYWAIALIGAILLFCFKCISFKEFFSEITLDSSINPLKIIVLFFSMTLLSIVLDELGFFRFVANYCINKASNKQISIFTILFFTISILTVFTSNDIVILTFTPFICYFCKETKINPIPYLILEFIAANTLSMALMIGNPTNIYLSLSANLSFIDYFKVMFWRSLVVCLFTYGLLLLVFRRKLKEPIVKDINNVKLENKINVIVSLSSLILCTILMAISSYFNIEIYLISLSFAVLLLIYLFINKLITHNKKRIISHTIARLPYALIPFLLSMFTLVIALTNCGILDKIAPIFTGSASKYKIGYSSFIACSLMNNIPMSVLYSKILFISNLEIKEVYASIIGSNIGALFTPLGALAGIMFLDIIRQQDVKFSFFDFIKYGMPISIVLMSLSLLLL